jgi:hypothetical protein
MVGAQFRLMDSHLLEEISALFGGKQGDELLFCHRQDASESDDKKIADQVSMDFLGSPAHIMLFKAVQPTQIAASISPCVFIFGLNLPLIALLFALRRLAGDAANMG